MEPGKKKKGFGKTDEPVNFNQIERELLMQVNTCGCSHVFGTHFLPRLCQKYSKPHNKSSQSFWLTLKLTAVLIVVLGGILCPVRAYGQNGQVLQRIDGSIFEGSVFTVQEISATAAVAPYTSNARIAVLDDGYRRIFMNPNFLLPNIGKSARLAAEIEFEIPLKVFSGQGSQGVGSFQRAGPFNEFGHRTLYVSTSKGTKTFVQGITKITPRYVVVNTLAGAKAPKQWTMHLARGTVPKSVLRSVLLKNIVKPNKAEEYFDIALFWQQINDFTQAEKELLLIESKFPDMTDRITGIREELAQLKAMQYLREIDTWMLSGQVDLGVKLASAIDTTGLAGDIQARFRDVLDRKVQSDQDVEEKRTKVLELLKRYKAVGDEESQAISLFGKEIETNLKASNAARLDGYLRLADAAGTPDARKVSLAISGWVAGSNLADENLNVTSNLFAVRSLVREYLTRVTPKLRRSAILNELSRFEASTPKFIDAIIKQMLPIDAPDLTNYTREKPIEFEVTAKATPANPKPQTYKCLAHLPPEYDPYRNYPLILTMPGGNQSLEQHLNMWCGPYSQKLQVRAGHAMRNGYIVVAVQWNDPGQSRWKYSAREHQVVLKAHRAAMRKFSIDSDRVFLSGHGIGGDGAYDIGLSHPEHWAGVLGFSGSFGKYTDIYKSNTHVNLPMYCVNGQKHHAAILASQDAQNKWMANSKQGYPDVTVVHYIGRANEQFAEEIPEAIKWMRPQKRRWPDTSGFKFECSSLRPTDSYFWFFEMYGTPESNVVRPALFDLTKKKGGKLVFKGTLKQNENVFRLEPQTLTIKNKSTLWLSPDFIDFGKKVQIRGRGSFNDSVNPSREVLLNDVRRRADREHPFWGRIDLDGKWKANPSDKAPGGGP